MSAARSLGFVMLLVAGTVIADEYRAIIGGADSGYMKVERLDDVIDVQLDIKQNGRGPTVDERIKLDEKGLPTNWTVNGTTTFGSTIDEAFLRDGERAFWRDAAGEGEYIIDDNTPFYVNQNGSSYYLALIVAALEKSGQEFLALAPNGSAKVRQRETIEVSGPDGDLEVIGFEITGITMNPQLVFLDEEGEFFATSSPRYSLVRKGYESADATLRDYADRLSTQRFVEIQAKVARVYDNPVRIKNVRVFDPETLTLSDLSDVLMYGQRISSVHAANSPASDNEVVIDGEGGSLVAGMYEMHGHLGQGNALLNIAAGVTSLRDMGNENDVLEDLMDRIDQGVIAGPRITRSCFIEGQSEFSAATGETVSTLEEGLAMVRWCGARDFHQVKFYNSMRPEWAQELVAEAKRLGLRVAGHVPAFASADQMIAAGFDEITHANQLMLGWVLEPHEDTRTLFRFTAMKRFPTIDVSGDQVQSTIQRMKKNNVAHDPTIAIHEHGLTALNGEPAPLARKVIDHLPTNEQRSYKAELFGTESAEERAEYVAAFKFIVATLSEMHKQGILLLPGTDMGGSFSYHRELDLFQQLGMSPAEVLRRASFDMAAYLGQDEDLGSIEKGKYADFFLVPGDPTDDLNELRQIRMVVSNGVIYFPDEIYPWFGIRPFAESPTISEPVSTKLAIND